uniref:Deformed n=1 Tax=Paracyclopina nana TaxID=565004 RepID=A0A0K2JMW5_PARNA|nr:Deformed [Paracyclopina nana]ALB00315.1 Deformed [Paracyclopina nana]
MITPAAAAGDDSTSIMSSFLMNSAAAAAGSYDPKFLEADHYSQASASAVSAVSSGYMGHTDYYAQHAAMASHGYPGAYPTTSMALNNQQASLYGREQMSGYGGYYQNCGISPHHQQMLQHQMAGHLAAASHLTGRSPVASPQPQGMASANVLSGHGVHDGNGNSLCGSGNQQQQQGVVGGNGGTAGSAEAISDPYGSPPHHNVVPQPQLTPGGGDGMSSDCSDDESSPNSNRQMPVVYPWMKKIHVGGVGGLYRQWQLSARHGAEASANCVHPAPDPGAGEGVPLQPLPNPAASHRDRPCALFVRTSDQNLVPEPANEVQKGQQVAEHEKRASEDQPRGCDHPRQPKDVVLGGLDADPKWWWQHE